MLQQQAGNSLDMVEIVVGGVARIMCILYRATTMVSAFVYILFTVMIVLVPGTKENSLTHSFLGRRESVLPRWQAMLTASSSGLQRLWNS